MTTKSIQFRGGGRTADTMVQACRAGRMTQHRVPIKGLHPRHRTYTFEYGHLVESIRDGRFGCWRDMRKIPHPFGPPGKILAIKETFANCGADNLDGTPHSETIYRADGDGVHCSFCGKAPPLWKPPQHMCGRKVRTFVRVKRVWVEKLQDISLIDAMREGAENGFYDGGMWEPTDDPDCAGEIDGFERLWNSIYGKTEFAWDKNPHVFACEWEVVK